MDYKKTGEKFVNEINELFKESNLKVSFVTGGGFAYDSLKYTESNAVGDFDFMIIYEIKNDVYNIIDLLKKSQFKFNLEYINMDLKLLMNDKIDIIRLTGTYCSIKSTINIVPKRIISEIITLKSKRIIKKIAHGRNTSLFFAYGSNNSRITVNFISPSFVTENECHYIHLDFSNIIKNNNIYFGILADSILKGFQQNYDRINFAKLRLRFIKNINNFFKRYNIPSENYINLFANNRYFPQYIKNNLMKEFLQFGQVKNDKIMSSQLINMPIIFTIPFDIDEYKISPFNFINTESKNMNLKSYILKMQCNEYDRQYIIDAIGKFLGYIKLSCVGKLLYFNDNLFEDIVVYGKNDLYLPNIEKYDINSVVDCIIKNLIINVNQLNFELYIELIKICIQFLSINSKESIKTLSKKYNIDINLFKTELPPKWNIKTIKKCKNFNDLATYHNYISKVMREYTDMECSFFESIFDNHSRKILDVMCGYGRIANKLKEKNYNYITGIDNKDYSFLSVSKDFIFLKEDFFTYQFNEKFDYILCMYNSFNSLEQLDSVLKKIDLLLSDDGVAIFDVFNKNWRKSIDLDSSMMLYEDSKYKLIINRHYDNVKDIEETNYILYKNEKIMKKYNFKQVFFDKKQVENLIKSHWDYEIITSQNNSRNNNQKYIIKIRRKYGKNSSN